MGDMHQNQLLPEANKFHKGTGRHIACFILEPKETP